MAKQSNQDFSAINAGVKGDLKSPSEGYEFPKGEPQHDDVNHYTGIGFDVFEPLLPTGAVKGK